MDKYSAIPGLNNFVLTYEPVVSHLLTPEETSCEDLELDLGLEAILVASGSNYFGKLFQGRIGSLMKAMRFSQVLGNSGLDEVGMEAVLGTALEERYWGPDTFVFEGQLELQILFKYVNLFFFRV